MTREEKTEFMAWIKSEHRYTIVRDSELMEW